MDKEQLKVIERIFKRYEYIVICCDDGFVLGEDFENIEDAKRVFAQLKAEDCNTDNSGIVYFVECPNKGSKDKEFEVATGMYPNGTESLQKAKDEAYDCAYFDMFPQYTDDHIRLPKARVVDSNGKIIKEYY